jgi:two-component system, cell cycle response regulator
LDGEQAWETLLLDPSIRVVITDLSMPKLDGYGLLKRIRASGIRRIREMPVVVVSGSDEQEERDRAKAAGASDLITKGIGTAQLLSRLDVLSNLVHTQRDFERGLEALVHAMPAAESLTLTSRATLWDQAQLLLASAVKGGRNFVVLNVCVGIRHVALEGLATSPPTVVVEAIGQLLQRTVRQSDLVARTGDSEFTLATGSINFDSARAFAQRICRAISSAHMLPDDYMSFVASCGVAALSDEGVVGEHATLQDLYEDAHKRSLRGLNCGLTGVVGQAEEQAFERGEKEASDALEEGAAMSDSASPDLATLLQWVKEGRQAEVIPFLGRLSSELKPLVELLQQQVVR